MHPLLQLASTPMRLVRNIRYRIPHAVSFQRDIFIVGVPRSGTTLLKTILAAHSRIGGSVWESTGVFGLRDIFKYNVGELGRESVVRLLHESNDIVEFYERMVDCLLELNGDELFVDKLQPRWYRLWYVHRFFPDAVFVHIVRDGRDCYCSALRHPNVHQSTSATRFASYWTRCVALPDKYIDPQRLHTIRYEDLTNDPRAHVGEVMRFLQMEFEEDQVDADHYGGTTAMKRREVHQNLGEPISVRSQERWRRELDDSTLAIFDRIAGRALTRFDYPTLA